MTDKHWKHTERMIAKILGGRRVPVTGRQRGDVPDIEHKWLSIEVKDRRSVPNWIEDAIQQAEAAAYTGDWSNPLHRLPIAILHHVGKKHSDDIVFMRLSDFVDWFVGDKPNGEN